MSLKIRNSLIIILSDMQILPDYLEGPEWELFFRVFSGLGFVKVSYSVLGENGMWLLKCQNMAL